MRLSGSVFEKMFTEHERWSQNFSGSNFYYGLDAGPVARRVLRYARPLWKNGARALDAGCGEGQDLVFLAQNGYEAMGVDFTANGIEKARRLLEQNAVSAQLLEADLTQWRAGEPFEVVIAVNSLQFLGEDAPAALENVKNAVADEGFLGFSAFAREDEAEEAVRDGIYRWHLRELLANFADWQPLEAARLWQWGKDGPQPFVTLVAQKTPPTSNLDGLHSLC